MSDYGTRMRENVEKQVELRLLRTYTEAQKDILKKLDEFTSKYKAKDKKKRKQLEEGKISEEEYKRWVAGQVFMGAQWEEKVKDITDELTELRKDDLKMIHNRQIDVFATNANYTAYKMEHDIGKNFGFDLYDEDAVKNLIEKKPALLPEKIVDPKKHNSWNQGIIANSITQGIIQGESIPKIASRIANNTANQNMRASTMYARTAMTCAQNSGRMQMLRDSKAMGINVKKQWMATHDQRTRDSHIHLDGKIADVEKPFKSDFGNIEYPGDPKAHPGDVYNCRCTLVYVYPEYDDLSQFKDDNTAKQETAREWIDRNLKNRFTGKNAHNIISTGGHDTDYSRTKPEKGWQKNHAVRYYKEVAAKEEYVDARKIAKQVDLSVEQIEEVRKHLFIRTHDFGNGEVHKFHPSYEQSLAWQRLVDGKGTETDVLLILHEHLELEYEKMGYSITEAHSMADQEYGWWKKRKKEIKGEDYVADFPLDEYK